MTDVDILLYDGFDELDAVGPFEVFQNAGRVGAPVSARLVTLTPRDHVTASHGLRVVPDGVLADADDPDRPDLVVVPGGGWSDGDDRGVRREYEAGTIPAELAALHDAGADVAAVCTGAMLLERAGLLDGRPAVTHHSALEDLRASGVEVVEARVVDDGDVATAGGVTAGIDLALHLVGRGFGGDVADEVAGILEYERRGEVHVA